LKTVIIYQRILPHYRVPFFERLYEILLDQGIQLQVVYGNEKAGDVPKTVHVDAPWARYKKVTYFNFLGAELVFQHARLSDFERDSNVIVEQSNRLLINYVFYFFRALKIIEIGLWGHGKNFQSTNEKNFKERFKRKYSTFADWWFCYTASGKQIISQLGFPSEKISVVRNSVDLGSLIKEQQRLKNTELAQLKERLGISGNNIAVYCGGMYAEKRIGFLLDACSEIKKSIPDYHVIFIGSGPDEHLVTSFCEENTWAHYVGSISGIKRVKYFSLGKVLLMPGAVGLAILDSFALNLPLVTTNITTHGPEIDYLESEVNGLMVEHNIQVYAQSVSGLLQDDKKRKILIEGCNHSKSLYSIETMAQNFADGVLKLLGK